MHRKEDNGQDERAADGGPDPDFRSLVHAAQAEMRLYLNLIIDADKKLAQVK